MRHGFVFTRSVDTPNAVEAAPNGYRAKHHNDAYRNATFRSHPILALSTRERSVAMRQSFSGRTSPVPNPFNLEDVPNLSSTQHYKDVQIFAKIKSEDEKLIWPLLTSPSSNTPDEIKSPQQYFEGAYQKILVNSYERNPEARKECIAHHGLSCKICHFNFGNRYGDLGEGYIHVHHFVPLSKIGKEYIVDPVNDLIPLCANCHAMVHRTGTTLTVDQVRKSLKTRLRKKD